jgi:uridine kinase
MTTIQLTARPPLVVAIAGPSGAGKSTLVQAVAALLDGATTVLFDDYSVSSTYPVDPIAWLHAGADPREWQTPQFAADLAVLRSNTRVLRAGSATVLNPTPFIVIEEPFGRERPEMAALIDVVVVIDIPLEIALARRLRRHFARDIQHQTAAEVLADNDEYLAFYLNGGRDVYQEINSQVLAGCDLRVDGERPIDLVAAEIVQAIRAFGEGRATSCSGN